MPEPVTRVEGRVAPLDSDDVDTDQIIPAQFLKVTEKTGLGRFLFYRWRYDEAGKLTGKFVLDRPEYAGAKVLLAGRNFGIGSSRENAVWALLDLGIRCVLASSFGDIFYNNSAKNGLLCIKLSEPQMKNIRESLVAARLSVSIDLAAQTLNFGNGTVKFEIEPHVKERLASGMDDIVLTTTKFLPHIESYEKSMAPYLRPRSQKS